MVAFVTACVVEAVWWRRRWCFESAWMSGYLRDLPHFIPCDARSLQVLVAGKSARALNQMGQIPREQVHLYMRFLALLRDSMQQVHRVGSTASADDAIVATGSSYLSEQEQAMEEAISTMFAFRTPKASVAHESQSPAPPKSPNALGRGQATAVPAAAMVMFSDHMDILYRAVSRNLLEVLECDFHLKEHLQILRVRLGC